MLVTTYVPGDLTRRKVALYPQCALKGTQRRDGESAGWFQVTSSLWVGISGRMLRVLLGRCGKKKRLTVCVLYRERGKKGRKAIIPSH